MKYIDDFLDYLKVVKKHSDNTIISYHGDILEFSEFVHKNILGIDKAMVEVNPEEYQERRNGVHVEPEANEGEGWGVEDLDYSYIDDNDTGYVGEDFLDEMLVDAPVEQVMEEEEISSPEELLNYYVISLEEGGIGISEEYKEMLLNKIKNALED